MTVPSNNELPRVLAIDDERLNLMMLNTLLREDCRLMVATSGE